MCFEHPLVMQQQGHNLIYTQKPLVKRVPQQNHHREKKSAKEEDFITNQLQVNGKVQKINKPSGISPDQERQRLVADADVQATSPPQREVKSCTSNDDSPDSPRTLDMKSSLYNFQQYERYLMDYCRQHSEKFGGSLDLFTCSSHGTETRQKPVIVLKRQS